MSEDPGAVVATLKLYDWTGRLWHVDTKLPQHVEWGVRCLGGSLALQRSREGNYELFRVRSGGPWEKLRISTSFQEMKSGFDQV